MNQIPDKSIDLVLTDPPYGIKADGGTNGFGSAITKDYVNKWDRNRITKDYVNEILRVSKNLIFFGANYYADILPLNNQWAVWDKVGSYEFQNPYSDCELIYTTGKKKTVKKYTVIQQGFIAEEKERYHPTQKPVKLFELILQDYSKEGDLILDCFSGSGTTAIACHNLKRNFICIEKDEEYYKKSVERYNKHIQQETINFA